MLSGTLIGIIGVAALLAAALFMAILDRRERQRRGATSTVLSRLAVGLFLAAFVGGVFLALFAGLQPRPDGAAPTGKMMSGGMPGAMGEGGQLPPDHPPLPPNHPPIGGMGATGGEAPSGGMAGQGSALPSRAANPQDLRSGIGQVDPDELQRLEAAVAKDQQDLKSRERLGHLYLQQQDIENVFRMAHEALQIDPKNLESRAHMGMALFSMGQSDKALAQFDRALAENPRHLESLLFKGIVQYQGLQDLAGAKATWQAFMKTAKPSDYGYGRVQAFLAMIDAQTK